MWAAVTMTMENPPVCATGVVPSAPRVTVHDWDDPVPPGAMVTRNFSDGSNGSQTLNWITPATEAGNAPPLTPTFAMGNAPVVFTVHDSTVPAAGAVVPPVV